MLVEVEKEAYLGIFSFDPHPFISERFIELNQAKTERVIRLINHNSNTLGLIAGIKNGVMSSPFSSPFGGFHFRNEIIYVSEIDCFLSFLKDYVQKNNLKRFEITLPPDIYHRTFNAKMINAFFRNGFLSNPPEITNWVSLNEFNGSFLQKNSREYYRQALRNNLTFSCTEDEEDFAEIYRVIYQNRRRFDRPVYMTLNNILNTGTLWPVDFFKVTDRTGTIVASAIFYRFRTDICYAVFWGDSDEGRPLRAMDFLTYNLWDYYKKKGYKYIDLGISTEQGSPNEGLLRFKESHDAVSSLRYTFYWQIETN